MAIHEDQKIPNKAALQAFNTGVVLGVNDAAILADANLADLQADVTGLAITTQGGHEDRYYVKRSRIFNALKVAFDIGTLTNALIAAADTVAGIRTLFDDQDASITDLTEYGGRLWGE